MPPRIVRLDALTELLSLSRSTIYRLLGAKAFPPPLRLSNQAVGWDLADVEVWIANRKFQNQGGEI